MSEDSVIRSQPARRSRNSTTRCSWTVRCSTSHDRLVGLPLTAGPLAKCYIVAADADSGLVAQTRSGRHQCYRPLVLSASGTTLFISQSRKARHMNLPRSTRRTYRSSWLCSQHFVVWFGVFPLRLFRLTQSAHGDISDTRSLYYGKLTIFHCNTRNRKEA